MRPSSDTRSRVGLAGEEPGPDDAPGRVDDRAEAAVRRAHEIATALDDVLDRRPEQTRNTSSAGRRVTASGRGRLAFPIAHQGVGRAISIDGGSAVLRDDTTQFKAKKAGAPTHCTAG